jgi:NAD(P)-dependent dehydrogenase (short-subunit alcohol dehydrogenase family)
LDEFRLDGSAALVTGASSGIGRAAAVAFARAGADVAVLARREEKLRETAEAIERTGRRSLVVAADVTEFARFPEIIDLVISELGRIDVLVNNAGSTRRVPILEIAEDDWDSVMDTNAKSALFMSKAAAAAMIARGEGGKIVNTASMLSDRVRDGIVAYCASKAALAQITRSLALELAEHNIQANAVAPGYVTTELTQPLADDEAFSKWVVSRAPARRWGKPEDVAGLMVYLATPAADFITGQVIFVDGGWTAGL